ncbi:hypothetical protein FSP39_011575 [Pinctada imbricata]|uniref:C-type lectin domain-containing protein n=1 Tax=Pinctada imbricata TaxID=66713 RepID=A0AA89C1G5_PINIB|nr:hypothetical protein FSP39_011575 [Pinctada imbricata]
MSQLSNTSLSFFSGGVNCNSIAYSKIINGNCFWIIKTEQDMLTSQDICRSHGGYLALISDTNTMEDIDLFADTVNMAYENMFIGYKVDPSSANAYVMRRLDGQIQSYAPFYSQTGLTIAWHCVILLMDVLYPRSCDDPFYALCSDIANIDPTLLPTSPPPPSPTTTEELTTAQITSVTDPITSPEITTPTEDVTEPITTPEITTQTEDVTEPITSDVSTTTTTHNHATSSSCDCNSYCNNHFVIQPVNMTDELIEKLNELSRLLSIEKKSLSLAVRRKISASDDRASAAGVGAIGIAVLVVIFGGIALFDLIPAFKVLFA